MKSIDLVCSFWFYATTQKLCRFSLVPSRYLLVNVLTKMVSATLYHTTWIQFYADMHVYTASNSTEQYHFPLVYKYFYVCVCVRVCTVIESERSMFFFLYTPCVVAQSTPKCLACQEQLIFKVVSNVLRLRFEIEVANAMCVINVIFSEVLFSAAVGRNSMTTDSTNHTALNFSTFYVILRQVQFQIRSAAEVAFIISNAWKRR